MTQTLARNENYLSDFNGLESTGPAWLQKTRKTAFERFSELGLPTARRGNEKWKYTNVAPIANTRFAYAGDVVTNGLAPADIARSVPWDDAWTNLVPGCGLVPRIKLYTSSTGLLQSISASLRLHQDS